MYLAKLFGDYWHRNEQVDYFAQYGFTTLVIWESELEEPELVLEKIYNTFYAEGV